MSRHVNVRTRFEVIKPTRCWVTGGRILDHAREVLEENDPEARVNRIEEAMEILERFEVLQFSDEAKDIAESE